MERKIRVLIVDDSRVARLAISECLAADPEIDIADYAYDGVEAIQKVMTVKPDVITLDIEMPRMDGLRALEYIMSASPTPVVMLSNLTRRGGEATIKSLELGAVDFFLKPLLNTAAGSEDAPDSLRAKVKMAARANVSKWDVALAELEKASHDKHAVRKPSLPSKTIIVIGCSTGGPSALRQVISKLPACIPASVLVIQHMPAGFTKNLAERLNDVSELEVKEAEDGDVLSSGKVLIAPGGYHTIVTKRKAVALNQDPPVGGVRPSIDVTVGSVVDVFKDSTFAVVLTGMGTDGTKGAGLIKEAGGKVIVQDETTCLIYGMPKSVADAGNADVVMTLNEIAPELIHMLENGKGPGTTSE